ncbi:MAG TPA: adenylate/guanylate cyclase domain-containing protein [Terriglobales bacterium]|nr:adenylate/guanylate cyclase domain-containing protein [Terriglobales bacterium]
MRITYSYRGKEKVYETTTEFMFGRAEEKFRIGLDLAPDAKASRLHGRIWFENDHWWIEDLNSSHGTRLNDREIKGKGKQQLQVKDVIQVGETTLRIEALESPAALVETNYLESGAALPVQDKASAVNVSITHNVDATKVQLGPVQGAEDETARRLRLICDLPLKFSSKANLEALLPAVVESLCELFPKGESWALVLREANTDKLLLKAYNSARQPYLSETLARRAMTEQKGFIWQRNVAQDVSRSIMQAAIDLGMYAPLLWQDEVMGVICGGALSSLTTFTEQDLRLLVVVAQYASMAVATHRLQAALKKEWTAKANLMRQFSPKVAERLMVNRGRLRLGGERSEVTILNADIRGFTNLARGMEPDDVVQLLNDYFAAAVPVLFARNGTIDKYIGDAILAVFGSPESDPDQHQNAVLAAGEIQVAVNKLNEARQRRGEACPQFGIGIHCGEVVHGFVGTADRMEFTVIGDVVNRTARYCAAAAGGDVLISPEMYERVWRVADTERVTIKTKHEGDFVAYRVKGTKETVQSSKKLESV